MRASEPCPHCGAVQGGGSAPRGPLDALYEEVERIREIAERQESERATRDTIARLTREVQALRETVALLRGTTHRAAPGAAPRPRQHVRSPAA
jgi:hypothetical protein